MSKTMIALAVTVLVTFIGSLHFISHNKSEKMMLIPSRSKHIASKLPPKPEERWRYIKELENQIGAQLSTGPSPDGNVSFPAHLTNKQHRLLEQIQINMRPDSTSLNEVVYKNDQNKLSVTSTFHQGPARHAPEIQATKKNVIAVAAKEPRKQKQESWVIHCGSFPIIAHAESMRAKLAFIGIESHISNSSGQNHVMLGSYSKRSNAEKSLQNLRDAGVSNCIPISGGG